jgi:hypothetical protein
MADETKVISQEGALVGDEAIQEHAHTVEPQVVEDSVDAQVAAEREPEHDKVSVQETFVAMDRVITDPSSPEAVQIPDAGRGSLDLPIHALKGKTAEQQFEDAAADEAKAAKKR